MPRSDPRYHRLDVRAETLTAAQAAKIEQDADDEVSADLYFARNLSATLRRRGLTATDFAAIMGEDDRRMRRLAAGETFPRYSEIPTIARHLRVDAAKLAWSPPAAFRLSLRRAA